jgi:hypothetical protein
MKQQAKKLATPGSWKPGQSGNPAGRKPRGGLAFAEAIREHLDPKMAIDLLVRFAADESVSAERRLGVLLPWMQAGYLRPPAQAELSVKAETSERNWHAMSVEKRREIEAEYQSLPLFEGGDDAREESAVLGGELSMHNRVQEGDG